MTESMELPYERWFESIGRRKSRRRFVGLAPGRDLLDRLHRVCQDFRPFPEARAVLVERTADTVFKGIIGSYGRISGAPCYLAFLGDMKSPRVQESVGYTGEGLILEATALGLATCWVGGFFYPEKVGRDILLEQDEKVLAITPVGVSVEIYSFSEKMMTGFVRSRRRKDLAEMVEGRIEQPWMTEALEAARLTPSAVNRQPWRFRVRDGGIDISVDDSRDSFKISKRLDCGIAMLHLELGARKAGAEVRWEFLDPPDIARLVVREIVKDPRSES